MPDGSEQERITDSSFEIIISKVTNIHQVLKNHLYGGSDSWVTYPVMPKLPELKKSSLL